MADRPQLIQLSRGKGFRLQESFPGAVIVARPGPWGNPFRVKDMAWLAVGLGFTGDLPGWTAAAVELYRLWLGLERRAGPLSISAEGSIIEFQGGDRVALQEHVQRIAFAMHALMHGEKIAAPVPPTIDHIRAELRGKHLACWCKPGAACHGDVLLEIANG